MSARLAALAAVALLAASCGSGPDAKHAAELVPADASAYVAFHGARPPGPGAFPFAPPAYAQLERALPPRLTNLARNEDIAVLPEGAVAFVQPRDPKLFDKTLDARGLLHRRLRGWTVVATTSAPLDAVRHRHATLDRQPGDAPLSAYLTKRYGGIGLEVTQTSVTFRYRAAPAPTLPDTSIPKHAVAAIGLTGEPPASTTPELGVVSRALGLDLTAVLHAIDGPTIAYVEPREPVPLVTLWANPRDPQRALREVGRLVARIGPAGIISAAGLTAVDLGPIELFYGLQDGRLVLTDAADGATEGREAVPGLPDEVVRFAYVHGASPTLAGLAAILGVTPRPVRDLLLYETENGGIRTRVVRSR